MKKKVLNLYKKHKDFYEELLKLEISETRIPDLILSFHSLYNSLAQMDDENLNKIQRVGLNRLFLNIQN